MNKKHSKLSLNKHIMANLDNQAMAEANGGVSWTDFLFYLATKAVEWTYSRGFDDRGACHSDECSSPKWCGPFTDGCPQTDPGDCIW